MIVNNKKPIIYLGRIIKSKGIDTLIHAVYLLYKNNFADISPLWIIGGNYEEIRKFKKAGNISEMIVELENNNLLFWWGHLPHEMLPYILQKSAMLCFTSQYEPGGRTVLEAMASELPVLATPHGFAEEIIQDGINGFIIKNASPGKWAKHIKYLLKNKRTAKKIGENAKKTIIENYSMKLFYEKHWDVYKKFIPKYSS